MKTTIAVLMLLAISGCGWFDRTVAGATGFARSCVDGVLYYQFTSGVTVAYEPSGKIKTCQ